MNEREIVVFLTQQKYIKYKQKLLIEFNLFLYLCKTFNFNQIYRKISVKTIENTNK